MHLPHFHQYTILCPSPRKEIWTINQDSSRKPITPQDLNEEAKEGKLLQMHIKKEGNKQGMSRHRR